LLSALAWFARQRPYLQLRRFRKEHLRKAVHRQQTWRCASWTCAGADWISSFRQEKKIAEMSEWASLPRHKGEAVAISAASSTNQNDAAPPINRLTN
jgi:hypothetical protein